MLGCDYGTKAGAFVLGLNTGKVVFIPPVGAFDAGIANGLFAVDEAATV